MSPDSFSKKPGSYSKRSVEYTNPITVVSFSDSDRARFWTKVRKTSTCWLWTGAINNSFGHGGFSMARGLPRGQQKPLYAHRVSWELANGPIPDGQWVLHSCDVPACVNPAHLFLGTHRANMEDAARKGRLSVTRPSGQKVSDAQVSQIRTLAASGTLQIAIARQFGVSDAFVCLVLKGKRRQHPRALAKVPA